MPEVVLRSLHPTLTAIMFVAKKPKSGAVGRA